jgi:8-oxo-dGTP pyrophosphatase MutT (NUDIX family)
VSIIVDLDGDPVNADWLRPLKAYAQAQKAENVGEYQKGDSPRAAGIAVHAQDTGRVLMIQRAADPDDDASGMLELPGGQLDGDESALEAAIREWQEETGLTLPDGLVRQGWESKDGCYVGFVLPVDHESDIDLLARQRGANPDDPHDITPEPLVWWEPTDLKDNPAVREEIREHPKRMLAGLGVDKSAQVMHWEHDVAHAGALGDALQGALLGAVPTAQIAEEWAHIVNHLAPGPGEVEGYLETKRPQVQSALEAVLDPAWQEAWQLGVTSAERQVEPPASGT